MIPNAFNHQVIDLVHSHSLEVRKYLAIKSVAITETLARYALSHFGIPFAEHQWNGGVGFLRIPHF